LNDPLGEAENARIVRHDQHRPVLLLRDGGQDRHPGDAKADDGIQRCLRGTNEIFAR